jgi:AcrR family transcriptional regulator
MAQNTKDGRSRKRNPEAILQRKRTVLDAAAREFAENGYSEADMDRIAEGASVGKGTIYRYYSSKEKLFEAVADDAMGQLREYVFSSMQKRKGDGPLEQVMIAGKAFLEFFDQRQPLLEVFLRGGSQFRERMQIRYLELYEENIHIIQDLLDQCIRLGHIRKADTRKLADIIGDMLVGIVYMWGVRKKKTPLSQKWPFVEKILLEGILAT